MKLIYKKTGKEVELGDVVNLSEGDKAEVVYLRPPHKPGSSGKVSVKYVDKDWSQEFYVSVIGAEWIDWEESQ